MAQVFVFADESGNFDFRSHLKHDGPTRYFSVGTLVMTDENAVRLLKHDLDRLRFDLSAAGHDLAQGFHASEDEQAVRDKVYELLCRHPVRFDATILEKAKAQPQVRADHPTFYKYAWFYHFRMLAQRVLRQGDQLVVVSASIGTKKMKTAFRVAVEDVVRQCCDWRINRKVLFWDMASEPCLQAADYGLWAVSRSWERGDDRALLQIPGKVSSQYDLWARGKKLHY